MAFKLIEAAQDRWRAVNAPHLVALVRAGAVFVDGKLVERPDETTRSRLEDLHPQVLTIAPILTGFGEDQPKAVGSRRQHGCSPWVDWLPVV
jgi:hypothetical protein